MFVRRNIRLLLGIVLIFAVTYFIGGMAIHLPGIYFDAVYPDYLAAIGAFPEVENFTQITQHIGFPLLGNLYHGTITAAVQYLVLIIAGQANVYTLRYVNLFYFALIGCVMFCMLYKITKRYWLSLFGVLICVTGPNVISFPRTQYYIMLPGVIFLFLSIWILVDDFFISGVCAEEKLLLAGILQGIAFYCYFSYLLFVPASFFIIYKNSKEEKITKCILYGWGILLGSICYFWGYYDSFIVNFFGKTLFAKGLFSVGCLFIAFILVLPTLTIFFSKMRKYRKKIFLLYLITGIIIAVLGLFVLVFCLMRMSDKKDSLEYIFNLIQTRNSGSRLLIFWQLAQRLVSNISSQGLVYGKVFTKSGYIYITLWLIILAGVLISRMINVESAANDLCYKMYKALGMYIIAFYVFSLPIIKGMQEQHFVALYFVLFLMLISGFGYLSSFCSEGKVKVCLLILTPVCLLANIYGDHRFTDQLKREDGAGYYSIVYSEFADTAYKDKEKDGKIYVFPEWGFFPSFIYLTSNSCQTVRSADIDIEDIQKKLNMGYQVVVASNDPELSDNIIEKLEYDKVTLEKWYDKQNKLKFYSFNLSGKKIKR